MKLKKLGNWFGDREPEKNQNKSDDRSVPPSNSMSAKTQLKIERLERKLQLAQKELAQAQAQLQINQGFQIELGETQLKLQQTEAELQRSKKELFERQKQLVTIQKQYQSTERALAKATAEQDWLKQLKVSVRIAKIEKTLPKRDFETLWGFGILSPKIDTTSIAGAILVRGWVLGKKSEAQTVRVLCQGQTLLETKVDCRRPLIAQQYPDIAVANKSGFEFSLAVTAISAPVELNLEATLKDKTLVSLCNFVLSPEETES